MPSIQEILAARKKAEGEKVQEPAVPKNTINLDDPDNALIAAAIDMFGAEIEKNPPEIATPFGPRVAQGVDHEAS